MDEPPTGWPSYSETSKGMIVMLLDGYRYLQNKRRGERVYWVCDRYKSASFERCPGRVVTLGGVLVPGGRPAVHNHAADAQRNALELVKSKLRRKARLDVSKSLAQIYREEVAAAAPHHQQRVPSYDRLRSTLYRARRRACSAGVRATASEYDDDCCMEIVPVEVVVKQEPCEYILPEATEEHNFNCNEFAPYPAFPTNPIQRTPGLACSVGGVLERCPRVPARSCPRSRVAATRGNSSTDIGGGRRQAGSSWWRPIACRFRLALSPLSRLSRHAGDLRNTPLPVRCWETRYTVYRAALHRASRQR